MGRLTLNVLLSFAQFEREVTGERIRDKVAASKKKGMWMGGYVPLGYDLDRQLVVNQEEAEAVRRIFSLYVDGVRLSPLYRSHPRVGKRENCESPAEDAPKIGFPNSGECAWISLALGISAVFCLYRWRWRCE
jgi:site-specific DNA recombinase